MSLHLHAGSPAEVAGRSGFMADQAAKVAEAKSSREEAAAEALTQLGIPVTRDPGRKVRWIEAANAELTDAAMSHLADLPALEWLEIGGGKITAAGFAYLKNCLSLKRLYIHDVNLRGNALDWLANLKLEALSLRATGVTATMLGKLKVSETLAVLNLSDNDIDDPDLGAVGRFKNLEVLALQNTKVTGAGLARLKEMARLNVLNLVNCRVGDDDLIHFKTMPNLRIVQAAGTDITDKGISDFTAKFTMLAIFR